MEHTIFSLIKSALTGQPAQLPEAADWPSILYFAKRHQIVPLLFYGMVNSGAAPQEKQEFFQLTCREILCSEQQLAAVSALEEAFQAHKIDYLPLKGCEMKQLYPKSEMRTMADIDILIKMEQYDAIRPLMKQLGYQEGLESDHELHWTKPPFLHIELHKRLLPSYSTEYLAHYGEGWNFAVSSGQQHRFALRDEDAFIYLFTHMTKHYLHGGIGLRHFVDLWVYMQQKPNLDQDYICKELDAISQLTFYYNVMDTLRTWFEGAPHTQVTRFITQRAMESGSYGTTEHRNRSTAVRARQSSTSASGAKIKALWKLIFLPFAQMKEKYPFLKKLPFLLPVMWVVRWFSALLFKRKNIQNQVQLLQTFTQDTVDSYTAELELVGLQAELIRRPR